MNSIPFISRLSFKILSSVVIFGLFSGLILIVMLNTTIQRYALEAEQQKVNLLLQTASAPVGVSLFLHLDDQIRQNLTSIQNLKEVVAIDVISSNGQALYSYRSPTSSLLDRQEAIVASQKLLDPTHQKPLGEIVLYYSDRVYKETVHSFYLTIITVVLLSTFLLTLLAVWLRHLLAPLQAIARKLRRYKPGDTLQLDIPPSSDEINQIVHAFGAMQETINTSFHDLESLNQSLETKVELKTQELFHQFYTDALTKLPNRNKLQIQMAKNDFTALVLFNINDFKEVNDFFGIQTADQILIHVARWLSQKNLNIYRIGGDEFVALIYERVNPTTLRHQIQTLIDFLQEESFVIGEETVHISVTVGISFGCVNALTHADIALHKAREEKIAISFYDETEKIEERYKTNIAMSTAIRNALLDRRIICHYQPIVDLHTGRIEKYETLVRMVKENGDIVPPLEFLSIAKKTKLYPHITQEVVWQACNLFANRTEMFSINLSVSDISEPQTVTMIIKTLMATQTANRVIFEILETEGIEVYTPIIDFIDRTRQLGAKIAIDDFGTGYSNFENILRLNVDYIKIDGSLIKGIPSNPRQKIVVETIVHFARQIGAKTVAEFVSSEEIFEDVKQMDIDYGQGFFLGKPGVVAS